MAIQQSGSIGAAWPPTHDRHNNRVKGFCPTVLTERRHVTGVLGVVREIESGCKQATRTTVRAFVERGLVEGLRAERQTDGFFVEAVVPTIAVPGHSMVYFGRNQPDRMPEVEVFEAEMQNLTLLAGVPRITSDEARERIERGGYTLDSVNQNGTRERDVGTLLRLYQEAYQEYTFEINDGTIANMLNNGNLVIVARDRETGGIVASLIAEHCEIALEDGRRVHLYELSDFATFRDHRGNGLMTLMQMEARAMIRAQHDGTAIIYSENRAAWEAVNRSSQKAGFKYCGTLPLHCVLVSDRSFGEEGRLESLHVWTDLR
ncbi:MAG: hypothetical protein ABID61_05360 [Candidatus Micrarchaeota archaeon]